MKKKLKIKTEKGYSYVVLATIVYLHVVKGYTNFYFNDGRKPFTALSSLKYFENILKAHGFGRMNNQQVVNHDAIIEQDNMKIPNLTLKGYEEVKVPLSAKFKKRHGDFFIG